MPRLCEFYPGICLTNEEKARQNLSQGKKKLSQSTVNILPKHPHITKPSQTQTLQNPHIHTRTHTHRLQNNIKPPQYNSNKMMHIGKATQWGERTVPSF